MSNYCPYIDKYAVDDWSVVTDKDEIAMFYEMTFDKIRKEAEDAAKKEKMKTILYNEYENHAERQNIALSEVYDVPATNDVIKTTFNGKTYIYKRIYD